MDATVVAIPPAAYGFAAHPGGELRGTFAREHQMRMAVDETGKDARAAPVHTCIGRGCVAPMTHPCDRVSLNDYSAVLDDAECTAVALGRIICDQFADTGI